MLVFEEDALMPKVSSHRHETPRARCAEVVAREEGCQGQLSILQKAKAAADQEVIPT